MIHQPVSVVSQCGTDAWLNGLASGDQLRPTGNGSALEALRDETLYKSFLLFTYLCVVGPAAEAELNASNSVVDAALSAANSLTAQTNVVNRSITAASNNITALLNALDSNNEQMKQINDSCEYCRIQSLLSLFSVTNIIGSNEEGNNEHTENNNGNE